MVLAVDVGNSNIVMGGYKEGEVAFLSRMSTERHMEADQYAVQFKGVLALYGVASESIEGITMATVVPALTPVLLRAFAHLTAAPPLVLGLRHRGDIAVDIEDPAELGTDILASALAVRHTRPLPAVIIDMGTATKVTALDADGVLRGVAISPGLFISLDAMVSRASSLGGIPVESPQHAIGRNTPESMKSGVVLGSASMLDGMIDRFAGEMGPVKTVVATGGAAAVVVPNCRHTVELCDTLLLDGLYTAYRQEQGGA